MIDRAFPDRECLVRDHFHLAHQVTAKIASRLPSQVHPDLLSAASAGLVDAARRYDPDRGVIFEVYALRRIRGAVLDELRILDWAGRMLRDKGRRLERLHDTLTAALGRHPTGAELAQAAGLSSNELRQLSNDLHRVVVSIDDAAAGGVDLVVSSSELDPEEQALLNEQVRCLAVALRALPSRCEMVIKRSFFEGRTMVEIAAELGVTTSRACQIRTEALELLREGMNAQLDPDNITPLESRGRGRVSRRAVYRAALAEVG